MDFSVKYRLIFYVSLTVIAVSMISIFITFPEEILKLPLMSIIQNKTVTKEQLDGAEAILKNCNWPEQKVNELNQVLFDAKKEYYLKNNPDNATKLFNSILDQLARCAYKKDPEPNQFEITVKYLADSSTILSAVLATIAWIRYRKTTGKNIL